MARYEVPGTGWRIACGRTPGTGALLVYLHGLGCAGSRDWPPVAGGPALADRQSLWIDLLGFGQSDRPADFRYDLADQAAILAEMLVALHEPIALVGHSMGGTLAVLLAERLLDVGCPPVAVLVAEPNLRPEDASMSARAAQRPEERFVASWPRWLEAFPAGHYQEDMRLADPVAFHRSAVSLVQHGADMLPRFLRLPMHKGYLIGENSGAATWETAEQMMAADVPVRVVPESGHGFSADNPAGFAAAIGLCLHN